MTEAEKEVILEHIEDLPEHTRDQIIQKARAFFTPQMKVGKKIELLEIFKDHPTDARARVVRQAISAGIFSLHSSSDNEYDVEAPFLIDTLEEIPAEERGEVMQIALSVFTPRMDEEEKAKILQAITAIPAAHGRRTVVRQAKTFFKSTTNAESRASMISAIGAIPPHDQEDVLSASRALFIRPDTSTKSKVAVIEAIGKTTPADRPDVLWRAHSFFNEHTTTEDKAGYITCISYIHPAERNHALQHARSLFTPLMSDHDKIHILSGIIHVPADERDDIVHHIHHLPVSGSSEGYGKRLWMGLLTDHLPREERETAIREARPLFTPGMHWEYKRDIVFGLRRVPSAQREGVVQRTLEDFRAAERRGETEGAEDRVMFTVFFRQANPHIPREAPQEEQPFVNPFQVHQYADTPVELPRASSPHPHGAACAEKPTPKTLKLNDAILYKIHEILHGHPLLPIEDVRRLILERIPHTWSKPEDQAKAKSAFIKGFSNAPSSEIEDLRTVVTFLQEHHPHSFDLWLSGFLGEALTAYEGPEGSSCIKGIRERAVLGLRSIDPHLDVIFEQVEGPELAKRVFADSNPATPKGLKFIATKLKELGYVPGKTTPEEGGRLYNHYLQSLADEYPSVKNLYDKNQIEFLSETIESALSPGGPLRTHLRPPVAPKPKAKKKGPPVAPRSKRNPD